MDLPFLKTRRAHPGQKGRALILRIPLLAALMTLPAGCLFDDPLEELDPALFENASFDTLPPSESFRVARRHILESFGAYGCVSCPEAEGKLLPYIHPQLGSPGYNPELVIVNYHVQFPGYPDPWITPGTQARHDQFGFTSLPQVKMNGLNKPYGIREKDVRFAQAEYDSLVYRLRRVDSLTFLDLRVDTSHYDTASRKMTVRFTVSNRSTSARGGLSFQVLAVKNRSVVIPIVPNHPWEVIVAETTDRDSAGQPMVLPGMPGLRAKSWVAAVSLSPESEKTPPPPNPENPADYAIVVFVRDVAGVVQNVAVRNYAPQP